MKIGTILKENWIEDNGVVSEKAKNNLLLYVYYADYMKGLDGYDLVPSPEGGCCLKWVRNNKCAYIDFFNDGSIAAFCSDRINRKEIWQAESEHRTLRKIRDFLND